MLPFSFVDCGYLQTARKKESSVAKEKRGQKQPFRDLERRSLRVATGEAQIPRLARRALLLAFRGRIGTLKTHTDADADGIEGK